MQRNGRLFLGDEKRALVLVLLAPLFFGCVKLKSLDCESSPGGCKDLKPDARVADAPVVSPDGPLHGPADAGQSDLTGHSDSGKSPDSAPQVDSAVVEADGGAVDAANDVPVSPQDAFTADALANDSGRVSDAGRSDTADAMLADTARTPDGPPADTGPTPDAGPIYTVTFSNGIAKGAMSGYGWVTMGVKDIVSSPTCGTSKTAITPSARCVSTSTNWESTNALCLSGTIPALSNPPLSSEYTDNWGLQVGANASPTDPPASLGRTYGTISLNFTGTPTTGLRITLHRSGDPDGTTYCARDATSGTAIPLTSFNTTCWDGAGTALTTADLPKIDKVGLEVFSTQQEITVTSLCLTSIVFGS